MRLPEAPVDWSLTDAHPDAFLALEAGSGADPVAGLRVLHANPAVRRVLGMAPEGLIGLRWEELECRVFLADRPEVLAGVLEHGTPWVDEQAHPWRGRERWWRVTLTRARPGLLTLWLADITEHQRLERQRAEFEQQLIGIVSHDLRNPLGVIHLGVAALLRRGEELEERTLRSLHRIQSATERASRMVRDLLDFTQARLGGGIPLVPQPVDLHALCRQVVDEAQSLFPEREVLLEQHGDCTGRWDGDRLSQVLQNLLTNALKYSPADTPVSVVTRAEEDQAVVRIHNEGPPIPADRLARLFEPLQRGSTERGKADRSVGLGLYIVRHIVTAHGGGVRVQSTHEEGTTFTVRLPRALAPDSKQ